MYSTVTVHKLKQNTVIIIIATKAHCHTTTKYYLPYKKKNLFTVYKQTIPYLKLKDIWTTRGRNNNKIVDMQDFILTLFGINNKWVFISFNTLETN